MSRKEAVDRYNRSPKGIAARARYAATAKGKDAEQRKYARQNRRLWSDTIDTAHHRGHYWTAAEIEQGMRDDLPIAELAKLLGRTYGAVNVMRGRVRRGDMQIRDEPSTIEALREED